MIPLYTPGRKRGCATSVHIEPAPKRPAGSDFHARLARSRVPEYNSQQSVAAGSLSPVRTDYQMHTDKGVESGIDHGSTLSEKIAENTTTYAETTTDHATGQGNSGETTTDQRNPTNQSQDRKNTIDQSSDTSSASSISISQSSFTLAVYCFILSISGFFLGWDVGTTGNLITSDSFRAQFGTLQSSTLRVELSSLLTGCIISSFNLGCLIGCLSLAQLPNKLGYKLCFHLSTVFYFIGSVIQLVVYICSLKNSWIWLFMSGRLLCGVCCGSLGVIGPIYISHCVLDSSAKGFYLAFCQSMVCASILLGNIINYLTQDSPSWTFGLQITMTIIVNLLLFVVPESRFYYLNNRQYSHLRSVYKKLLAHHNDHQIHQISLSFIRHETDKTLKTSMSTSSVFRPPLRQRTLNCALLMIFQQLTGINYFFYFGSYLFNKVLSSQAKDLKNTPVIIMSVVNLIGGLLSGDLISRLGCYTLLMVGSSVMTINLVVYSLLGFVIENNMNNDQIILPCGIIMIILSCCFIFCFAISWGPCSGVLNNEVSQDDNKIMGISISLNWLTNFIISIITPFMISSVGFGYGLIFGLNILMSMAFVFREFRPKPQPLSEEIELVVNDKN